MTQSSEDDAPRVARSRLASGNVYVLLQSADRNHRIANRLVWIAVLAAAAIMLAVFAGLPI